MDDSQYPSLFRAADRASRTGQNWYVILSALELCLILVGALLSTFYTVVDESAQARVALIVGLTMLAALVVRLMNRVRRDDIKWFDGRAAAETVKSVTWRYMMRIAPFADDDSADDEFASALRATLAGRPQLEPEPHASKSGPISPFMRDVRGEQFKDRRTFYITHRLADQADWYAAKARQNRLRGEIWFVAGVLAQLAAVSLALARTSLPLSVNAVGFLAALAATAAAWTQIGRHDELAKAYGLAAEELRTMLAPAEAARSQDDLARVVELGELSISREHTMWMAKRAE